MGSPYARSDSTRTRTPILPRDGYAIPGGGVPATSGGAFMAGINGMPKRVPFSSSKTSNVATGPKISCWMIGALEVLDFDQAGPVEGAGGQRSVGDGSAADDCLGVAGRVLRRSDQPRATAAESIRVPSRCSSHSPGPTTTCVSRSSRRSRT